MTETSAASPAFKENVALLARALVSGIQTASLYPPTHPQVAAAVGQFHETVGRFGETTGVTIGVTPDTLLLDGRPIEEPDAYIVECATLLHERDIVRLTLSSQIRPHSLQTLLTVLALDNATLRGRGGPAKVWNEDGDGAILIEQLDYHQILRDSERTRPQAAKDELWLHLLTSYSDEKYVGSEYARELSQARTRAVEVEDAADDPPDRITGWLDTVADTELRALDLTLLVDLLDLESDPFRWRDLADTVVAATADLSRQGRIDDAVDFVRRLVDARGDEADIPGDEESKRAFAQTALDQIATGPAMRHALGHLREQDDEASKGVAELCTILGPSIVTSLAEVLANEQDARARRRLRDILLAFGKEGRDAVQQLLNSANWEVRQTAALLLREFGGTEGLSELQHLLTDKEPLVQREAIRSIILIGDERTYSALVQVLTDSESSERSRSTLIQQLTSQRDARSVPLCAYLIKHIDHRTMSDVYLAAVETLGNINDEQIVEPLRQALYRGEWWAPFRTRTLRQTAARSLRRSRNDAAIRLLRDAESTAPRGVKRVARAELSQLGDTK